MGEGYLHGPLLGREDVLVPPAPWKLQYLQRRRNRWVPSLWSAVGGPWGGLLTIMTSFLLVTSSFDRLVMFPISIVVESDTTVRPLAVVRIRADKTATVTYFRRDKLPDVRAASVRKDLPPLPLPPIPKDLGKLGTEWVTTTKREGLCDERRHWECERLEFQRMLVARNYHRSTDWEGIAQALHEAVAVGIVSDVVFVEGDDAAAVDAIIHAMDLCLTLGLRPSLRMQ